jgi:prepilin-type N-terminal cleavage/methylation domain-containing protein
VQSVLIFGLMNNKLEMGKKSQKGFTIIELIVVIAIISLLASIVLVNVNGFMAKARDARRKSELVQMQKALIMYYADNGSYPSTPSAWWGTCSGFGTHDLSGSNGYIPNLAGAGLYMAQLPIDPRGLNSALPSCSSASACYAYKSNGISYKILALCTPENFSANDSFNDPYRDNTQTGYYRSWMVCSENLRTGCTTSDYNDPTCPCYW